MLKHILLGINIIAIVIILFLTLIALIVYPSIGGVISGIMLIIWPGLLAYALWDCIHCESGALKSNPVEIKSIPSPAL